MLGSTTAGLPQAAYAASKAAIIGLTRDLAQQWTGRKGIRVNALAPGFFPSEITDQYPDGYLDQMMLARARRAGRARPAELVAAARLPRQRRRPSYITGVLAAGRRRAADDLSVYGSAALTSQKEIGARAPVEMAMIAAERLQELGSALAHGRLRVLARLPQHQHQRLAGRPVDEVQRAGEARFLLQRGEHLLAHDPVHRFTQFGGGTTFDELGVHVGSPFDRGDRVKIPDTAPRATSGTPPRRCP